MGVVVAAMVLLRLLHFSVSSIFLSVDAGEDGQKDSSVRKIDAVFGNACEG